MFMYTGTKSVLVWTAVVCFICLSAIESKQPPLILVSLDGMRASSLDQHLAETPKSNFKRIIDKGLKADYMAPIFPSLTFPNHWTLVTGKLYKNLS